MIREINERIKREICRDTIDRLTDDKLMGEYRICPSVKMRLDVFENILRKNNLDNDTISKIMDEYLLQLIPPAVKACIRGNKFNRIIRDKIISLFQVYSQLEIEFEKDCLLCPTLQKPDWYILDKYSGKVMIGMNQVDLWGGGHQLNRGTHYIHNTQYNNTNFKLVCVVCNDITFKRETKAYHIVKTGFQNNTLCYPNNLDCIIKSFFNLILD